MQLAKDLARGRAGDGRIRLTRGLLMAAILAQYPGIDGFLGTRGSLMLDFVFAAMFGIVPILIFSVYLVKYRQQYRAHKLVQLVLGGVLLVAVTAFELDMRFGGGWIERARPSPYWETTVYVSLYIHLFFAIPTAFVWIYVIVAALRNFPRQPGPCAYSAAHRFWGWLAAVEMTMTAVTGWVFYWLAFGAT